MEEDTGRDDWLGTVHVDLSVVRVGWLGRSGLWRGTTGCLPCMPTLRLFVWSSRRSGDQRELR
eukprot:365208-Chlamydomonas_euryale.AAC.17